MGLRRDYHTTESIGVVRILDNHRLLLFDESMWLEFRGDKGASEDSLVWGEGLAP